MLELSVTYTCWSDRIATIEQLGASQQVANRQPSVKVTLVGATPNPIAPALLIWLLSFAPALSWGSEGHHIIARIAASELTPKASAAVADLLGGETLPSMVTASMYADKIRPTRRETAPWHYVNIEIDSGGYDSVRDCPDDSCIVAQIKHEEELIGDAAISKPVRAEALRFLIHFMGDLHQPLHCADNHDRGGNMVRVVFQGEQTNLHAVWDTAVVEALGGSEEAVAATLESKIKQNDRKAWSQGTAENWANETWAVARRFVYGSFPGGGATDAPIILPSSYANVQRDVVARQLERAGVRLAEVLNRRLK